ncbi:MAG: putative porin [Phycisphaerae bacterium]|nr:putative porin [Phycisphaerae bacterium]
MRLRNLLVIILVLGVLSAPKLFAADDDKAADLAEMKKIIKQLNARIEKLESEKIDTELGAMHKKELARLMKEILADANTHPTTPKWMENLTFFGDFRLRYQHDLYNGRSGLLGATGYANRRKSQNLFRFRLRFGFIKTWWDKQLEVGFRLASGNGPSTYDPNGATPLSTNQTMTNMFSKKPIWIDLAYARYKPKWAPGLVLAGGKMPNPIKSRTWMTWAVDINPEGFVAQYVAPYWGNFKPYVTTGLWFLENTANMGTNVITSNTKDTSRNATMVSIGSGFDWELGNNMSWYLGGTMYMYHDYNCQGIGYTGIDGSWVNNSGWADSDMQLLELTSRFGWEMLDMPWEVVASWTHNFTDTYSSETAQGLNATSGTNLSYNPEFDNASDAFLVGIKVGENKKKGDWSAFYNYAYIEANAVPAALTESTFEGPNRQGHMFGGAYNIDDFLSVSSTIFITEPIHAFNTWNSGSQAWQANSSRDGHVTIQLNLVWKF